VPPRSVVGTTEPSTCPNWSLARRRETCRRR
jgi:hypothetical protein